MKTLSAELLASKVATQRKAKKITQIELSKVTGINRALISQLENKEFTPSVNQLMALASVLDFNINDVFADPDKAKVKAARKYKIAVAGTGYVGLSLAVLLAQNNEVTAVDIIKEKVDKLNNGISPIQDEYIERFLNEAAEGKRSLNLTATTDGD
jgi:UDPglucose 6-dehydrogenase